MTRRAWLAALAVLARGLSRRRHDLIAVASPAPPAT